VARKAISCARPSASGLRRTRDARCIVGDEHCVLSDGDVMGDDRWMQLRTGTHIGGRGPGRGDDDRAEPRRSRVDINGRRVSPSGGPRGPGACDPTCEKGASRARARASTCGGARAPVSVPTGPRVALR